MALRPVPLSRAIGKLADDEIHVWHFGYRPAQGRAPLRRVLAGYLGIGCDDVALADGAHGRPALDSPHDPALDFNWSHSGTHAVVAVGRRVRPGVDLEQWRPRPRALEIARRYFSAAEVAALEQLAPERRSAAFLAMWTGKEAVLKAVGRGIAFGLHRLTVAATEDDLQLLWLEGDEAAAWQLQRLDLGAGRCAALAWRGDPRDVRIGMLAMAD